MSNKIIKKIKNNYLWPFDLLLRRCSKLIPNDSVYIQLHYLFCMHRFANLKRPKTFNEKLQWLKLHDKHLEYTQLVDKYEVKEYVRQVLGDEVIIPTLGVYDSFDEIDFDALPEQFVLKTTHDSGGVVVCPDKSAINKKSAQKKIERSLHNNFYYVHREYPYKDVKPRIIAEKYMVDESGTELKDYKFFCFDGVPKILLIVTGRGVDQRQDFYDMNFELLPVSRREHPNSGITRNKPDNFEKMMLFAQKLSKGFPHVRVDLYNISGRLYFGELTFFSGSGNIPFVPEEWDYKIGEWLKLPTKHIN